MDLVKPLPEADRVSCGFPGMVRNGIVLSAPHFVCKKGPGSPVDKKLTEAWDRFDLATALSTATGKPTKVANDADMQGAAVVQGNGLEVVITLGTGMGSAFFMDGHLMPHLELGHHPFRKDETYDDNLGELARKSKGDESWNHRVQEAIARIDALFFFDHLYIGGGNARRVNRDALGDALERITIVDNTAGILGGIKLWDVS
jgi:polyphosphate glucokinase